MCKASICRFADARSGHRPWDELRAEARSRRMDSHRWSKGFGYQGSFCVYSCGHDCVSTGNSTPSSPLSRINKRARLQHAGLPSPSLRYGLRMPFRLGRIRVRLPDHRRRPPVGSNQLPPFLFLSSAALTMHPPSQPWFTAFCQA